MQPNLGQIELKALSLDRVESKHITTRIPFGSTVSQTLLCKSGRLEMTMVDSNDQEAESAVGSL